MSEPIDQQNVRLGLPARISIYFLTFIAVCFALHAGRVILLPLCFALVLAFLLSPLMRALETIRIPRSLTALLLLAALVTVTLAGIYRLVGPATSWVDKVPQSMAALETKVRDLRQPIAELRADLHQASEKVEAITSSPEDEPVLKVEMKEPSLAANFLTVTGSLAASLVIVFVTTFFFLVSGPAIVKEIINLPKKPDNRRTLEDIGHELERQVSHYLLYFTLINIALGFAIGTTLWLLGLPNPILWGVMAGLLNFIPYVGAIGGAIAVFLAALISFATLGEALAAPLCYLAINSIEGYVVTPMILGRSMRLNPILILLSIIFWGWMWGIGGALLSVPLLITMKIICDHVPAFQRFSRLLAANGYCGDRRVPVLCHISELFSAHGVKPPVQAESPTPPL